MGLGFGVAEGFVDVRHHGLGAAELDLGLGGDELGEEFLGDQAAAVVVGSAGVFG